MSYIDKNLMPNESVVQVRKRHWSVFLWPLLFLILPFSCSAPRENMPNAAAVFQPIGFIWLLFAILSYVASEVAITNRRLVIKLGLVGTKLYEMKLEQIESLNIAKTILGGVLGYGKLEVKGAGGTRYYFRRLPRPETFREAVYIQMEKAKSPERPS